MRPSLIALLSSVCLVPHAAAIPLGDDVALGNATHALLRRDYATDIEQLFNIEAGAGDCLSDLGTLNKWLGEAILLHKALVSELSKRAETNTDDGRVAKAFWRLWFGVSNSGDSELEASINDSINRVTQFLTGGGLTTDNKAGEKPRLFCSAAAGTAQSWQDIALDDNGDWIEYNPDRLTETRYVLLMRIFPELAQADNGNVNDRITPYWMPMIKGYDMGIGKQFAQTLCPVGVADNDGNPYTRVANTATTVVKSKAMTYATFNGVSKQYTLGYDNRHILFCPEAFSGTTGHDKDDLSDVVSAANYPVPSKDTTTGKWAADASTQLGNLMTRSTTLYHELYHLTGDGDYTPDTDRGLNGICKRPWKVDFLNSVYSNLVQSQFGYNVADLTDDTAKARVARLIYTKNPESYAFAAMAAYILQNPPTGQTAAFYFGETPTPATIIR